MLSNLIAAMNDATTIALLVCLPIIALVIGALVMFFVNIFLFNDYKNIKISLDNFVSCHKFISNANSSKFDYSTQELMTFNVLHTSLELSKEKSTEN